MIRLLLADDQALVRSALVALLGLEHDFEVVAQVGRGDEVLDAALDIERPGVDGLAAAAVLAERLPACRVIILTTFGRPGYLRRAMESGALGFVVKDAPAERLAEAVRRVAEGQRVVKLISAGEFPFDGTRTDFRPDPSWTVSHPVPGWDRPRAR